MPPWYAWLALYLVGGYAVERIVGHALRNPLAWPWWGRVTLWPIGLYCYSLEWRHSADAITIYLRPEQLRPYDDDTRYYAGDDDPGAHPGGGGRAQRAQPRDPGGPGRGRDE